MRVPGGVRDEEKEEEGGIKKGAIKKKSKAEYRGGFGLDSSSRSAGKSSSAKSCQDSKALMVSV